MYHPPTATDRFRDELALRGHFIAKTAKELQDELRTVSDGSLLRHTAWRLLSVASLVDAGVRDMAANTPRRLEPAQTKRLADARAALATADRLLREFHSAEPAPANGAADA
ncbi:hypothetical protein [Glycomyces sp. NPDC048151]|uniref:hypothetical protein n=1 Tax=Glycomyces sp. NPDC048151 TaxID=3364002 RepID=UPI00371F870F